jgi:hypothetical protein
MVAHVSAPSRIVDHLSIAIAGQWRPEATVDADGL